MGFFLFGTLLWMSFFFGIGDLLGDSIEAGKMEVIEFSGFYPIQVFWD